MLLSPTPINYFIKRRTALALSFSESAIAFAVNEQKYFFYLTGISDVDLTLYFIEDKQSGRYQELLVIADRSDHKPLRDGKLPTATDYQNISGIETVLTHQQRNESQRSSLIDTWQAIETWKNYHKQLDTMRLIKDEHEIRQIQNSIKTTHECFHNVCKAVVQRRKENVQLKESDLHAEIVAMMIRHHAHEWFPSIVGAWKNGCTLHYTKNNSIVDDNDLILIDMGACLWEYNADISRVIPRSGQFTDEQRNWYDLVLVVQRYAISLCLVWTRRMDIEHQTWLYMYQQCIDRWLTDRHENKMNVVTDDERIAVVKQLCPHSVGHSLGLDVHDGASLKDTTLQAWMVVTIEPGVYLSDYTLGIRIEDDILVTEQWPVNLSAAIPSSIEDIEALLQ